MTDEATDGDHRGLKLVLSLTDARATIGIQRFGTDPVIEAFEAMDISQLLEEAPGVITRAEAQWEKQPKYPKYDRPSPPSPPTQPARARPGAQPPTNRPDRPRLF